jgi:hypothetical protein
MEYVTVELGLEIVTDEGITDKLIDFKPFNEKKKVKARVLTFETKAPYEDANTFLYRGDLFVVQSRDENYFEALQIEVKTQ